MNRRHFFQNAPALAMLAGHATLESGVAADSSASAPADGGTVGLTTTPPVVMAPRADGAVVVWAVSRLSRGWVEWETDSGASGRAETSDDGLFPQADQVMKVPLRGLEPGTDYRIRTMTEAIDGEPERVESSWKRLRTLDPASGSTRFVVWNDTHQHDGTIRQLHQITPKADFLMWNGDTCNDWKKEELLIPTLLHPGGTDFSDGRPVLMTMGNHDVRGKYGYRVPGVIAIPGNRPYYAFRSGPVAFVCLHTGEDKPDDHPSFEGRVSFQPLRERQAEWLARVVDRPGFRDAPYRIVFCHIPLRLDEEPETLDYANGDYDHYARSSRDLWHESLVRWKAQVVISGHIHQAAYLEPTEAFPYAQLIGGGPQPEKARFIEGTADSGQLTLVTRDLEQQETHRVSFRPVAS
ncbi:MAG TPA: metallophosphoesterase [Bacteroidia bacterium]|nr:metallophosphoesterase [Bacteroidia bacterium]